MIDVEHKFEFENLASFGGRPHVGEEEFFFGGGVVLQSEQV